MFKKVTLAAAAVAASVAVLPAAAEAHPRGRANGYYNNSAHSQAYQNYDRRSYDRRGYGERSYDQRRYSDRRCSGTTGTILGAAAGALLGREIDKYGSRTTGTVVGGAAGALLGRQVGKSTCRR